MTVDEAIDAALAECASFFDPKPVSRSIYVRRAGVRQQELFAAAARWNPDYYGVSAYGAPDANGLLDLADLTGGAEPPAAESIQRIEVREPGASGYLAGERIHVVSIDDPDVAEPPRVTIRNRVIAGVDDDLDDVTSIEVYYSRRPDPPASAAADLELDGAFADLIVWDLARMIARRGPGDAAARAAAGEFFAEQEAALLALYEASCLGFTPTLERRH